MAVLWVLVILTMLATSIGRNTSIEFSLTKHAIGKTKAKYIAWGGLIYAMNQIRADSQHEQFKDYDTLYNCAVITDDEKRLEEVFGRKEFKEGYFEIGYIDKEKDELNQKHTGLSDEERKININTLTLQNYKVFKALVEIAGVDEESAETIASAVMDWKDEDALLTNEPHGAEDDYYMGLTPGYHAKNKSFDSTEELMLIRGITPEIFEKIKEYVTIFPKEGQFLVNFDTASETVLKALAYSVLETVVAERTDADSLVEKFIDYREGDDGIEYTKDDRVIDFSDMPINAKERVISLAINTYRTKISNYIRVNVKGVQEKRAVEAAIETVVKRDDLSIVYWKRN